jgi:hypothetical protein
MLPSHAAQTGWYEAVCAATYIRKGTVIHVAHGQVKIGSGDTAEDMALGPSLTFSPKGHLHRLLARADKPNDTNVAIQWRNDALPVIVATVDIWPSQILYI